MLNILMMGNSYLYKGTGQRDANGPAKIFAQLADAGGKDINIKESYIGNSTLSAHWDDTRGVIPRNELATGNYDILVMSGSTSNQDIGRYGDLFSDLARKNGTSTVYYGIWAPDFLVSPTEDDFTNPTHQIYRNSANKNDAAYAPNGLAYKAAYDEFQDRIGRGDDGGRVEELLTYDGVHASPHGALVAASVLYATIFGEKAPSFRPPGVSAEDARILQNIAWETAQRQAIFLEDGGVASLDAGNKIEGTSASNFLRGTDAGEDIDGKGGRDDLVAGGGDDIIDGGSGVDRVFAGSGRDALIFDNNDTHYFGGSGTDTFIFNGGTSTLDMRIASVEIFDLRNGTFDQLILQTDDIRQADGDLLILADDNDRIRLDTDQDVRKTGSQRIDGELYDKYVIGGSSIQEFLLDADANFVFG